MVSKYDVLYLIGTKGEVKMGEIAKALHKEQDYANIRKMVIKLEKEGFIKKNKKVRILHNEKTKKLYRLIVFCIKNNINYNFLFRGTMLNFIQKAARREFFTINDIKIHSQTFNLYTTALSRFGLLLIISQKPRTCKLLRHHFLSDLLEFFEKKTIFYTPKHRNLLPKIKKELREFKNTLKIHGNLFSDIEEKEEINFIYISLSLEGNPITISDTEKIIFKKLVPQKYKVEHIQEIANYKKAVDLMIENAKGKVKLTLDLILEYHRLAMAHIYGAGEIRKQNVRIKSNPRFKTCDWQLLPQRLDALMKKYGHFESLKEDISEVIKFAAFFHNEFQRIHPFIDGNSRTSRLLMVHILRSHDLPVLDLPLGYFDEYLNLTKRSTKRDDESFHYLIEEIVFFNLRKINARKW